MSSKITKEQQKLLAEDLLGAETEPTDPMDFDQPVSEEEPLDPQEYQAYLQQQEDDQAEAAGEPDEPDDDSEETVNDVPVADDHEAGDDQADPDVPAQPSMDLLLRAGRVGLGAHEIEGLDATSVERMVGVLEQRLTEGGESIEAVSDEHMPDLDFELDPDEHGEEVVEAFDKMKAVVQHLLKDRDASIEEAQRAAFIDRFDNQIAALGPDYEPLLGKGRESDMKDGTEQLANRRKILDHMKVLASGHAAQGTQADVAELFDQAVKIVLADAKAAMKTKGLSKKLKKRSKQMVARPTLRNAPGGGSAEDDALSFLKEALDSKGANEEADFPSDVGW